MVLDIFLYILPTIYVGELIEDSIDVSGLCTLGKLYNLGDVLDAGHIFLVCSCYITFVLQFLSGFFSVIAIETSL